VRQGFSERYAIEDGRGRRYPLVPLAWKLADTIVRTLVLIAILYGIAGLWWLAQ
jgi:hypothetical protein